MINKTLAVCLAALFLTGCAGGKNAETLSQSAGQQQETAPRLTLSAAVTNAAGTEFPAALKRCAEAENEVSLAFYGEELLGSAENMLAGAKLGTVSLIVCDAGQFPEEYPEWSLLTMPGLFTEPRLFNEWFGNVYKERINSDPESMFHILAATATDEKYVFTRGVPEDTEGLETVSMGNAFDDVYWKNLGVRVRGQNGPVDKRSVMESNATMFTATRDMFAALSLERLFSEVVPAKTMLGITVAAMNRSAWERLSVEEQKAAERLFGCVSNAIAEDTGAPIDKFAEKNHLSVYLPGYLLREKMLKKDAVIQEYKEVLGAEYVDSFLESVSRFNNKYTVR